MNPVWLYVIAWLLPLGSFLLLVLGGRHWGKMGATIACLAIIGSFCLSFYGMWRYADEFSPTFFAQGEGGHGGSSAGSQSTPDHEKPAAGSDREHKKSEASSDSNKEREEEELEESAGPTSSIQEKGKPPQESPPQEAPPQVSAVAQPIGLQAPAAQVPSVVQGPTSADQPRIYQLDAPERKRFGAWQWSFAWISTGVSRDRVIRMGFYVDSLTVIMFFMVTTIASLIHIFSIGYMHEELHDPVHDPLAVPPGQPPLHRKGRFPRFFTYLSLFCFSMLGLVLADNVFMVFMFWELVGLCSYLLIGFYYERKSASTAANKAFITNRVGDAGMIVGMMIIWTSLGTFNIQDIVNTVRDPSGDFVRIDNRSLRPLLHWNTQKSQWLPEGETAVAEQANYAPGPVQLFSPSTKLPIQTMTYALLTAAGIGIFIGCVGKSAQFPLHVWLPDAMEGPTPVSALIHAATMVAAGVYLVGRFYAFFTPEALLVIAYTGGITLFIAGTIALVMTDIKRVLAYSTVGQLGYMMLGLGVGGWAAGLFHLITHAFFKALLFLGSGSVIHGTGTQELPQMGGLYRKMPITALTMLVGVLAICGIPLFSGFYSKDAIVAHALFFWQGDGATAGHPRHALLFLLPAGGAALTAFYMFRLFFMTFTGAPRDHHVYDHAHESSAVMWVPLAILAVPSIIVGYGFGGASPLLERILTFRPPHGGLTHPSEHLHETAGLVALAAVIGGIVLSFLFYVARVLNPTELPRQFPRLYDFLAHKWYFDELYRAVLIRPALALAQSCREFDKNVLDRFIDGLAGWTIWISRIDGWFDFRIIDGIVNFVGDFVFATAHWLRRMQTGQIRQYVMFLVVAAVGLFTLISFLGLEVIKNLLVK